MTHVNLPLTGIKVVAIEQAVAGPLCSRHLADLGASVAKIERPVGGDLARGYDTVVRGESAYFVWLNRGKRSIAIDIHTESGQRTLHRLLDGADVLIQNLAPGAIDRIGLDWHSVHERWPRLIYCSISGYGLGGPFSNKKAFDLLIQAESGLLSITGSEDAPAKVGISIADIAAAMYALSATLAALFERRRTGKGRFLDISMLDCMAEWMTVPSLYQRYSARPLGRTGLHHATIAPYGPYRTRDNEEVVLAVQTEAQWTRFCRLVLEVPDLISDARFLSVEARAEHRGELDAELVPRLKRVTKKELTLRLDAADVPYAAMNDVAGLNSHPQLTARNRWVSSGTPSGDVVTIRPPFGFDAPVGDDPELGGTSSNLATETQDGAIS